jgi:hypothetical protein
MPRTGSAAPRLRGTARPHALRALSLAVAGIALAACGGGSGPSPRPRPEPGDRPIVTGADPLAAPWVVRRTGAPVTQTVHVAAVIESRADSAGAPVTDTLQSQLTVTWSLPSAGFPRRYLGAVQDYRLSRAVGDSLQSPAGVTLPIPFTAVQPAPGEQPRFLAPDETSCGSGDALVVQGAREAWLSLPDTLRPGMGWADSSVHRSCRDSIPLVTRVQRAFRVTGAMWRDSAVVITVERRSTVRIEGTGVQFGDSVSIVGECTGAMMYEVSLATGAAVFGSGESELRLVLRGSRRSQELTQRARISILDR